MHTSGTLHARTRTIWAASALALIAGCGSTPTSQTPSQPTAGAHALPPLALPQPPLDLPSAAPSEPTGVLEQLGAMKDKALEAIGLKKPEPKIQMPAVPDSALPDRTIHWRVHASPSLNITESGESLAVVLRVYRLKSPDAFMSAPMDTFGEPAKERQALESDLLSVRELLLIPGQRHELHERVPRTAGYIGVVAQFRQPAAGRWRYAFHAAQAERSGLHIGVHACALSVQQGEPVGVSSADARQVAVRCPANPYRPPINRDH